ncbi:hypothetical protein PPERSA_11029 [Pseudocohnilembus persalinus]|uniref:Transmembrane protein n=1 Tax=Pseudocohnilembus persalinus TaxID=266149 RepID=A0A0V0QZZ7_PSEPJ|nr:hypothetical protein PPERSA_11029 [Pseudocohnilembus persalinus]|eukprot:KRX07480.1 hypothetical protein PPERSA_11029 [Pseudocohnilembus persalinus]
MAKPKPQEKKQDKKQEKKYDPPLNENLENLKFQKIEQKYKKQTEKIFFSSRLQVKGGLEYIHFLFFTHGRPVIMGVTFLIYILLSVQLKKFVGLTPGTYTMLATQILIVIVFIFFIIPLYLKKLFTPKLKYLLNDLQTKNQNDSNTQQYIAIKNDIVYATFEIQQYTQTQNLAQNLFSNTKINFNLDFVKDQQKEENLQKNIKKFKPNFKNFPYLIVNNFVIDQQVTQKQYQQIAKQFTIFITNYIQTYKSEQLDQIQQQQKNNNNQQQQQENEKQVSNINNDNDKKNQDNDINKQQKITLYIPIHGMNFFDIKYLKFNNKFEKFSSYYDNLAERFFGIATVILKKEI